MNSEKWRYLQSWYEADVTGPVGPAGSTPTSDTATNTIQSVTKSALISYTDGGNSSNPRFVTNGLATAAVVLTSHQRVHLQVTVQLVLSTGGPTVVAATLGRGTTASPSDSYTNLANNTTFSVTALAPATSVATVENLLTSCLQTRIEAGERPHSFTFTVVDAPGVGTWFYALQLTTSDACTLYVRNSYITTTVINL